MKKTGFIAALVACLLVSFAAMAKERVSKKEQEKIVTREITVGDFDAILTHGISVEFAYGESNGKAVLSAPASKIDKVSIAVKDGKLEISVNNSIKLKNNDDFMLTLSGKVRSIEATSAAKVKVNRMVADEVSLYARTSAKVTVDTIRTGELDAETYTSGNITVWKAYCTKEFEAQTQSSGCIDMQYIETPEARLKAYSSGEINVYSGSADILIADAYTAGKIDIRAKVKEGSANARTAAKIRCPRNFSIKSSTAGSVETNLND